MVEKIKEMITNSMDSTYYLNTYREIMAMLKKERDKMNLFRDYMMEMDSAFE